MYTLGLGLQAREPHHPAAPASLIHSRTGIDYRAADLCCLHGSSVKPSNRVDDCFSAFSYRGLIITVNVILARGAGHRFIPAIRKKCPFRLYKKPSTRRVRSLADYPMRS